MLMQIYWRKPSEVWARPAMPHDLNATYTSKTGKVMQATLHDMIVHDTKQTWVVKKSIFFKTYDCLGKEWQGFWLYERTDLETKAVRLVKPHMYKSLESGKYETAQPGEWLLRGIDGEEYVLSDEEFKERYE